MHAWPNNWAYQAKPHTKRRHEHTKGLAEKKDAIGKGRESKGVKQG